MQPSNFNQSLLYTYGSDDTPMNTFTSLFMIIVFFLEVQEFSFFYFWKIMELGYKEGGRREG